MKEFRGKAIYNPSGKAGEYSYWACNFYVGCSNGCTYCYCKKSILATQMGMDKPQLKKCFRDESHALNVFESEMKQNLPELKKQGLFFSFTTDPLLPATRRLTFLAVDLCMDFGIPVKVLTKVESSNWAIDDVYSYRVGIANYHKKLNVAFGYTLTGCDELEPNASPNVERIKSMQILYGVGFKTFASIEPIVSLSKSLEMIRRTNSFCDLYKVGLMSGSNAQRLPLLVFLDECFKMDDSRFYFKDNLLKQAGIKREDLPYNCVDRNYNIFES